MFLATLAFMGAILGALVVFVQTAAAKAKETTKSLAEKAGTVTGKAVVAVQATDRKVVASSMKQAFMDGYNATAKKANKA